MAKEIKWGQTPFFAGAFDSQMRKMGSVPIYRKIALVLFLAAFAASASAQSWPSKPIRFIVSFPPGGSADLVARSIAPRMAEKLGQQVLVENRPGAGGNIGVDVVA